MHYYQHNVGDYARDTSHLTVIEHGIYRLLLDWCYLNEKPIPTERAMRVGRGYPTETQSVLSEFFTETADGWEHGRVLREIEKYHRKAKSNRENGMKGGRPKANANPMGCDSTPSRNPNQEPRTKNQEKDQKQESSADDSRPPDSPGGRSRFDEFWAVYPRAEGKKKARDVWARKRLDRNAERIISDVVKRKESHGTWIEGFVPLAATYLNGERWEDAITPRGGGQRPAVKQSPPEMPTLELT